MPETEQHTNPFVRRARRAVCRAGVWILAAAIVGAAGCGPGPEKKLTNPDPAGKIPAIKQAVRRRDRDSFRQLVKDLDSDDPAVRFYSIEALHKLTGETFGYHYYDDEDQRKPALTAWQAWLARQQ